MSELVYWRDPKKSGIVFGAGLILLFSLAYCSIISVVAWLALLTLGSTISFRVYKGIMGAVQKTNEGNPFKWASYLLILSFPFVSTFSLLTFSAFDPPNMDSRLLFGYSFWTRFILSQHNFFSLSLSLYLYMSIHNVKYSQSSKYGRQGMA